MTRGQPPVIIVGGGPAGAATGTLLARAGVDVVLVDRARFPRDKPCSEYMSPEASRVLADLGVLDRVLAASPAQLTGMRIRAPNGRSFHGRFADVEGYRPFRDHGLALRRTILDPLLLQLARDAGVDVREGTRVTDVVRATDGRACGVELLGRDASRHALPASLVVGADGLRSIVSRRLRLAGTRRAQRRLALVTHFVGVEGMGEMGEMHVDARGYLGLASVGGGVTNVAVVAPVRHARVAAGDPASFLRDWIEERPHIASRFRRATRVSSVLATGPFASAARRAWAPGAALVGDAADFFDPFTGEGIYAALRGAELLAPRVVEALGTASVRAANLVLADYEQARRREFGGKWLVERIIGAVVSFPALMNRAARALAAHPRMAHTLVGVTGDFVPAHAVFRPGFIGRLLVPWPAGGSAPPALNPLEPT